MSFVNILMQHPFESDNYTKKIAQTLKSLYLLTEPSQI